MNSYESVIIINPNVDEEKIKEITSKVETLINNNGKVTKVDELGIKKLAYEIKKCKEAYYFIFYFESDPTFITELERTYKITDEIIKFITVKQEKGEN